MDNKKTLYVALALVVGIVVGYVINFSSINNINQGASARYSSVSDAVSIADSNQETRVNLKKEQKRFQNNCSTSARKYVKVLSPNGGEVYTSGQQININWATCNYSNPEIFVILTYYDANSNGQVILGYPYSILTPNDGSEVLTLPNVPSISGLPSGNYYKILISDNGFPMNSSNYDFSDNFFSI